MFISAFLICTVIGLATVLFYFMHRRLNYWKRLGIPHDEPHFVSGNFKGAMQTRTFGEISRTIYEKYKNTGPFCGFYFFQRPGVLVLDLELVKHVLIKDFSNFVDRGLFHNEEDDPLTGHLFLLDGQRWRNLRNKLSPTFTSGKMKYMFPTILSVADELVDSLRGTLKAGNDVIEIKELLARFTTDVIGSCAFGIDCNSLKDPKSEFFLMGRRVFTERRHSPFVMSLIMGFPDVSRKLHVRITPDIIHNFFMRLVRETIAFREKENVQRKDFLNILIELNKGNHHLTDEDDYFQGLTVEQMAAQVFVFYVAGFETSSSTLGFALYELAQAAEVQQRLRAEVNEVLKAHHNEFTYECMKEMHYMKQVISETLRKYPIIPHLNRQALNDFSVPGHPNYVIKKGMNILVPVHAIHHDPDIYPDPEVFNPDRFTPSEVEQRDPVAWLPFGDGPRNCIGLRFGQMQMRVALTYLMKNFKFSVCEKTEFPLEMNTKSFVLNSKNGIFLRVEQI